ncbi:MAG: hypothetical protein U0401_05330 [Anaerolineae bacterium]
MKKQRLISYDQFWLILLILAVFWLIQLTGVAAAPVRQSTDVAVINSPTSNSVVRGVAPIVGSADHTQFQFYKVEFSPEPVTGTQWQIIGAIHNSSVINGVLENWDTTAIPDGSYTLRLQTVKLDGNYLEFFAQQIVVANTQTLPTDTPAPTVEAPQAVVPAVPVDTPTPLPPTPTIVVEQPVVDTPTPRPVETSAPLEDPEETTSFIPTVTGFSLSPLRDACLYGAGIMFSVFVLFGFLSALRMFIQGFVDRRRRKHNA